MKYLRLLLPSALAMICLSAATVSFDSREAFEGRCVEGLSRISGNLDVIASSKNDSAVRAYYAEATMAMFDSAVIADSVSAVAIERADTCLTMGLRAFLEYLDGRDDSVARVVAIVVPSFPDRGLELDSMLSPSVTPGIVMLDNGTFTPDTAGQLVTRWETTVFGEIIPAPSFGKITVRMHPVSDSTVFSRVDTVGGRILPVFHHKL